MTNKSMKGDYFCILSSAVEHEIFNFGVLRSARRGCTRGSMFQGWREILARFLWWFRLPPAPLLFISIFKILTIQFICK